MTVDPTAVATAATLVALCLALIAAAACRTTVLARRSNRRLRKRNTYLSSRLETYRMCVDDHLSCTFPDSYDQEM